MKRILSAVLLICCVFVWAAGCQNRNDQQQTTGTTTTVSTTAVSTLTTMPTQQTTTVSTQQTTVSTVVSSNSTTVTTGTTATTKPTTKPSASTTVNTSSVSVTPTMPTTKPALQTPYTIPDTGLVIEQIRAYDGIYVEDGSNAEIEGVAMIMLRNFGKYDVDMATITLTYGEFTREFFVTSLPKGATAVVQEKNRMPMASGNLTACTASVIENTGEAYLTYHDVEITENGDNSITIKNLTQQDMPSVRIFYKYFMVEQQLYVGGITFTVNVTDLKAGQSVTIKPTHYLKGASEIVMVQTYEVGA